jgi:carbon storage regulator
MLVLTRKKGERVMIGDDIVVTVIDVRGDGVRIGFDAPRGVSIQRAEVVSAVKEANTGAAASAAQTADLLVGLLNRARKPEPAEPASGETTAPAAPEAAPPTAQQLPVAPAAPRPAGAPPKPTPPRPRD